MNAPSAGLEMRSDPDASRRRRVILALVAVYLIWGSTYFAIAQAVVTIPPFLMAASRFIVAGAILYAARRLAGVGRPSAAHWRSAAIIGTFLVFGGNGLVSWAQQNVPSGMTALIVSVSPIFMVLIDWVRPGGIRPATTVVAGLIIGFSAMLFLVGPVRIESEEEIALIPILMCVLAPLLWSLGSVYARHTPQHGDVFLAAAMQMIAGCGFLILAAALTGEFSRFSLPAVSGASISAWIYLTVVGSLIGFSAYVYLLKSTTTAVVATHAYVNPVVAVFLGWLLGGETVTARMAIAAAVLIGSVMLISIARTGGTRVAR